MKINAINTFNFQGQTRKNVSFKEGKVEFFSDFDRTYFPALHSALRNMNPVLNTKFDEYCNNFRKFFDNTREGLKFHITTGRTFFEFQTVSELIRERGFKLPLPDTFIAKNGSDEYIKIATDEDFYNKGIFPFSADKYNVEKVEKIKELTGWDGPKIFEELRSKLEEQNLRIVIRQTEGVVSDYGANSLFYGAGLSYETERIAGTDNFEWVAGFRNDGNCKIFVTYPPDMDVLPKRVASLNEINEKMDSFLDGKKYVRNSYKRKNDMTGGRYCQTYEPLVDETLKGKVADKSMTGLTKLYDTKEAVKKAIKNNDLVIVAGDNSNDATMLNPLLYIDTPFKIKDKKVDIKDPVSTMRYIEKKELANKEIARQIEDLPLMGVVVKRPDKAPLKNLTEAFGDGACKFQKIVQVEEGNLEEGVKEAIRIYCQKHPDYAEKLSPDLKQEIFGTTGDISEILANMANKTNINEEKLIKETKRSSIFNKLKNKANIKYFLLAAFVIGACVAAVLGIKKSRSKKQVNINANLLVPNFNVPECFADFLKV